MLEIAICDDDAIILKTLGKYFGKLNDATIKYDIYNSADTLYRYCLLYTSDAADD